MYFLTLFNLLVKIHIFVWKEPHSIGEEEKSEKLMRIWMLITNLKIKTCSALYHLSLIIFKKNNILR